MCSIMLIKSKLSWLIRGAPCKDFFNGALNTKNMVSPIHSQIFENLPIARVVAMACQSQIAMDSERKLRQKRDQNTFLDIIDLEIDVTFIPD